MNFYNPVLEASSVPRFVAGLQIDLGLLGIALGQRKSDGFAKCIECLETSGASNCALQNQPRRGRIKVHVAMTANERRAVGSGSGVKTTVLKIV